MKTFKKFMLSEAPLKLVDIWKRDNKALFIKLAVAGDLVTTSGDPVDSVSSTDPFIKLIRKLDDAPETKTDEYTELSAALKSSNIKSLTKIDKGGNGFGKPSSGEPSGEDWESLIAVAVNRINKIKTWKKGDEWDRAEKFWGDYEKPSMKLGKVFIAEFGLKKLEQLGASTLPTNKKWKGKNKTPKTDLIGGTHKISLKKHGGSQLMSAGTDEAISTFEAAMGRFSISKDGRKVVVALMGDIKDKMGSMSTKGTIGALEKKAEKTPKSKRSKALKAQIKELDMLQVNADYLNDELNSLFEDDKFKKYFCWEAASGESKFKPSPKGISNVIATFKETGSLANVLELDSPSGAGKTLAKGNSFYVSFKTGGSGSRPYLALRSKKLAAIKKKLLNQGDNIPTFKTIITEEYQKEFLTEDIEYLDEFKLFDKLKGKIKNLSKDIVDKAKKILGEVMKRVSEAFDFMARLGEQMLQALLNFFGIAVNNVKVTGGGKYPLL
tara:strand:+ start:385 stop:1869 length:1485 start_codon:yes stop_codon:yes gene_type:complete